jgi:5-methylcytosine-specific restriction enzyme subunit McrC
MRDWQATHHDATAGNGISLLFPMNDLFEAVVAAALRRALSSYGLEIITQGGSRYCLGEWKAGGPCRGSLFRTRPDIIIRSGGRIIAIIDTKWKCLRNTSDDRKRGISQSDVYQLMAYAQLYCCDRLLLLYPHHAGLTKAGIQANYGIAVPGKLSSDRLQVVTVDVGQEVAAMAEALRPILLDATGQQKSK